MIWIILALGLIAAAPILTFATASLMTEFGKLLPDPRQHRVSFRMTDTFHKMEKTAFIGAAHGMFLDEPLRSYRDSVAAGGGA